MKLFKYGITLERLKETDIELVRQWRNSDPVRLNMAYREMITPEQQKVWFNSINNLKNNYMMIHYKGEKMGLLNDKNINWEERTSESGIFLGKPEYYASFVPYLVSVAGIESNFYFLDWNKQFAHILKSNQNAIQFNLQLGYRLCPGQDNADNQQYEITLADFEQTAGRIRKAVNILANGVNKVRFLIEPSDFASGLAGKFELLLQNHRHQLKISDTPEGLWYEEV